MSFRAVEPQLQPPAEGHRGVLVWRWPSPCQVLSSASVGGGLTTAAWLVNVGVPLDYARTDLERHVAEVADGLGLVGPGIGLLTAADVAQVRSHVEADVAVDATVGVTKPTWAADREGGFTPWRPGTINVVVQVPVPLDPGAAVNAVITATEAKSQALGERGVPGTGTASDAVVIAWPLGSDQRAERFAGPRSQWGSRIAIAVHAAVGAGVDRWRA